VQITLPRDINGRGQIVGFSLPSLTGALSGFVLSEGRFTVIQRPGAAGTALFGTNNRGQIVGYGPAAEDLASLPGAPLWPPGRGMDSGASVARLAGRGLVLPRRACLWVHRGQLPGDRGECGR
jgi:hypothetical protein